MAGRIKEHQIWPSAPFVSNLLFADNFIFFNKALVAQAETLKELSGTYERASGQAVNVQKSSVVFAKGIPPSRWAAILLVLDMRGVIA